MANEETPTSLRVLILEDRAEDAELVVHELRRSQLEPAWQRVEDEPGYLAALETPPDLILCDYNMPQLDAHRALGLLHTSKLDIPFIVVSGSIGEETAVAMMRQGADDYLLKDRLSRLGPAVRHALAEKRAREERREVELDLRASENRFHSFMSHSPFLASIKDEDCRILYINNRFEEAWHTTLRRCLGERDDELWPADAAPALRANDQTVLQNGETTHVIEDVPLPGGIRQMLSFRFPFSDGAGHRLLGGVSVDITEQLRTERALADALAAKEVLLQEVHHRVKNNLQIISSLLRMQSELLPEPAMKAVFRESERRVQAMATIHQLLYGQDDVERLDFREYVQRLAHELLYIYGADSGRIHLNLRLAPVTMKLKQAIPCGLILNELLTNCLKYAFPGGRSGDISVDLNCDDESRVSLRVADTGIGMPSGLDLSRSPSVGIRIVHILTKQLRGMLVQEPGPGVAFCLTFEAP